MTDPNIDALAGTRCQDCKYFNYCDFEDHDEACSTLGHEAVVEIMGLYGICTYFQSNCIIVSRDRRIHDTWGTECWEPR